MSEIIEPTSLMPLPAREDLSIRPGTVADLPFIDALQKQHSKQVGWMPTKTLEGKVGRGEVLIAESRHEGTEARRHEGEDAAGPQSDPHSVPSCLRASVPVPLGYCIGTDRYFKREDVGIIYQINVSPGRQRAFVGAALLKAMFDRAAYGCRLFCCWCAQDIEANRFWEAMGFVPLAFRAGSEKKARVHIFWQKRIRAGDVTTPYWFPSQTTGGSIREDRLVLPIPPGTHWSDAKPMVLPSNALQKDGPKPAKKAKNPGDTIGPTKKPLPALGRLQFGLPPAPVPVKEPKPKRQKRKNDPKLIAAARELRDRWLEQVNAPGGEALVLPAGKYDVCKAIAAEPMGRSPLLAA